MKLLKTKTYHTTTARIEAANRRFFSEAPSPLHPELEAALQPKLIAPGVWQVGPLPDHLRKKLEFIPAEVERQIMQVCDKAVACRQYIAAQNPLTFNPAELRDEVERYFAGSSIKAN